MARFASPDTAALHRLAVVMSDHLVISLDALSGRAVGKGGFFDGLVIGRDCVTATAARVLGWFDAFWPADLPWPRCRGGTGAGRGGAPSGWSRGRGPRP